jgi:hypothetical protein
MNIKCPTIKNVAMGVMEHMFLNGILNVFNLFPNEIFKMEEICMILPNELFKVEKTCMNHERIIRS